MKLSERLSFGEEVANSVSHGVMFLLGLPLLPWFAVRSYLKGGTVYSVGVSVFMIALLLMFLSSTLYHAMDYESPHKRVFRILDHSCIFLAIAGSYTPVALVALSDWKAWGLVALQWILVLAGIFYKVFGHNRLPKLSLTLYLIMGWLVVFFLPQIIAHTQTTFLIYLATGGLMYTFGAYFYRWKTLPYHHLIWHLFINLASICHVVAIVWYLVV